MRSVLWVLGGWILFGGSHVGLATSGARRRLVRRLGERRFAWTFVLVSSVLFTALAATYAEVRLAGPAGLGLAAVPWCSSLLAAATVLGFVLMAGALAPRGYWDSPAAILREGVRPARGLERVTRHPFFTGVILLMGSHALLARHLTGTVFFAGFVGLAVGGAIHQAHKLRARKGAAFAEYLETTSALPFLAILRGRQRLAPRELPWVALALGAAAAFAVRSVHEGIFAWHGAPLIVSVVGGSIVIGAITSWREQRARPKETP
jgi:uncharacterized membrane protein